MLRSALIRWLIYIAVFGFIMRGTDNYAHFGGLASGYLLGRVMKDRQPADVVERKRANLLGWVAGIAVFVSFGFMVLNYLQNAPSSTWHRPAAFGLQFATQLGSILLHLLVVR